jgi:hypothetical protein
MAKNAPTAASESRGFSGAPLLLPFGFSLERHALQASAEA